MINIFAHRTPTNLRHAVPVNFADELSHETLLSERLRATLLAAAYALGMALALLYPAYKAYLIPFLPGDLPADRIAILMAVGAIYELVIWAWWGLTFRARRHVPAFGRYFNALVEISFVTALIVLLADTLGPLYVLVTPVALAYMLVIVLSALRLDFLLSAFTGTLAAIQYALLVSYYLPQISDLSGAEPAVFLPMHHAGKALILFASGLVTGFVTLQIRRRVVNTVDTLAERDKVIDIFSQHVSREIADQILVGEAGEIKSEVRDVTVMFIDIRDFSRFAHGRDPKAVVDYLNHFFDMLIEIIEAHDGVVFKFMGDGILAVFGAPFETANPRERAVMAGGAIIKAVGEQVRAAKLPPTRVGIGIHCGRAVTGLVGSRTRKEYTVIGDVVNLASRIEQLNKMFGSQLLVSKDVWEATNGVYPGAMPLGPVEVRGVEQPVELWRLV